MKLTARQVDTAKPKEKPYKLSDGGGLYLEVAPNGSRYWRMKYRINGKEKRLSFGVYPIISLAFTPLFRWRLHEMKEKKQRRYSLPVVIQGK